MASLYLRRQILHVAQRFERLAHLRGHARQLLHHPLRRLGGERAGAAAEVDRHQRQRRELRGEALGRRHADLRPGVRVERALRRARDRRVDDVADRQHLRAALARLFDGGQRIRGLTALRDRDDEIVGTDHRIAVAELAGEIDLARDARRALDQELPDQAGVIRGAAREQHHAAQLLRVDVEAFQIGVAGLEAQARAQRVGDRARLLVDLLEHEVRVAALFRLRRVPGDGLRRAGDRVALDVGDLRAGGGDLRDVSFIQKHDFARVLEEGGHVRRQERLALAEAEDQR